MPWLSKRELAYYLILRSAFGYEPFNYGNAMDILKLLGPKKVARKVIKRLLARGFLERVDRVVYRVKPLDEALENLLANYVASRLRKYLKSHGIEVSVKVIDGKLIEVEGCSDDIERILNSIKWRGIGIRCASKEGR